MSHIEEYGGQNYAIPPGILNRLKVIAQHLEDSDREEVRQKMLQWSPKFLECIKAVFSYHSEKICNLKKISMYVDENDVIFAKCPECYKSIQAQRPGAFYPRYELLLNHVLTHYPTAFEDFAKWKKSNTLKRKESSASNNKKKKQRTNENHSESSESQENNLNSDNDNSVEEGVLAPVPSVEDHRTANSSMVRTGKNSSKKGRGHQKK